MTLPRYIAICGQPGHGKSTVQKILCDHFGVCPIDDGAPLRQAGMMLFDLTWEQVSTQHGKLQWVEVAGVTVQVRDLLGWLGKCMEARFGTGFMPWRAMEAADEQARIGSNTRFSFGSVRRDQGRFYQARGGVVIEVVDPRKPESPYDFDQYDRDLVDVVITNDGTLLDLEDKVDAAVAQISDRFREAA